MRSVVVAGLLMAVGCGDDDAQGGNADAASNQALCSRICTRAASKHCGDTTEAECQDACMEQAVNTPSQCNAPLNTFLRCASSADFTCDATTGEADAVGCLDQLNDLTDCFLRFGVDDGELDEHTDAGSAPRPQPGADGGKPGDAGAAQSAICEPAAGDDACDLCTGSQCCDELVACSTDQGCSSISLCLDKCDAEDAECQQSCVTGVSPSSVAKFSTMLSCFGSQCATACASSDETEGETDAGTPDAGSSDDISCLPTSVPPGYCTDPKYPVGRECTAAPAGNCVALENVSDVYCCAS